MDFITFNKHKRTFSKKSGIYIVSHKKYPGYVKIGSAPDIASRLTSYLTYTPEKSDWVVHCIAIKMANRTAVAQQKKVNFHYAAERTILNNFKEYKVGDVRNKTEWFKVNTYKVVQFVKAVHFGDDGHKADGAGLPLYRFSADTMYKDQRPIEEHKAVKFDALRVGRRERIPNPKYPQLKSAFK